MCLKISDLPKSVVQQYNLKSKSTRDGYMYVNIRRGMYGLPRVGYVLYRQSRYPRQQVEIRHIWEISGGLSPRQE